MTYIIYFTRYISFDIQSQSWYIQLLIDMTFKMTMFNVSNNWMINVMFKNWYTISFNSYWTVFKRRGSDEFGLCWICLRCLRLDWFGFVYGLVLQSKTNVVDAYLVAQTSLRIRQINTPILKVLGVKWEYVKWFLKVVTTRKKTQN